MTLYSFTREELENLAAQIAAAACLHLRAEKQITEEVAVDFMQHTPVLVPEASVLSSLWRRLVGDRKATFLVRFVRLDIGQP